MIKVTELFTLMASALSGGVLGVLFYGGLWWTIRKGIVSKQPAFWFLGSFLSRTAIVLVGFYFISGGEWVRLTAGFVGFTLARVAIWRLTSRPSEVRHATQS